MANRGVTAAIVPSGDPHFSEYTAEHFRCRAWLTGFTGSAGDAAVTMRDAALFTDSRYFLQAQAQLMHGISLQKTGLPQSITPAQFIKSRMPAGTVGVNAALYSQEQYAALSEALIPLTLKDIGDPFDEIWKQRPPLPSQQAFILPQEFAGQKMAQKMAALVNTLQPPQGSVYIVSALDQIAWLLNLRGGDIIHTPVALAYAVVDTDNGGVTLFIGRNKVKNIRAELEAAGVVVEEYNMFLQRLPALLAGRTAIYHPQFASHTVVQICRRHAKTILPETTTTSCINDLKSVKNPVEIAGIRQAMLNDGAAWIRFWKWLEENVDSGIVTELSAAAKIRELRSQMPHFWDESFSPIVAYGGHGAVVHYSPDQDSNVIIGRDSMLLVDTGAQYLHGTTDITRTLHLGAPTQQQREDYTLVLRGHIALQQAIFPEGTRGAQLDALSRLPMWSRHLLYMHGTGHGVGHFLGVHEGPQSFRLNENPAPLRAGMVTSCEPGIYREVEYGIRIENLILTTESGESGMGRFLRFEPLTLCPYDGRCICHDMLSAQERTFIDDYHQMVQQRLAPMLTSEENKFLEKIISQR
jgi:Xaa-Pro aminopeptidase